MAFMAHCRMQHLLLQWLLTPHSSINLSFILVEVERKETSMMLADFQSLPTFLRKCNNVAILYEKINMQKE